MAIPTYVDDRAMHSPAREQEAARHAWGGHPWLSFGIRAAAWGTPVAASVLCAVVVSRVLPAPSTLIGLIGWWVALSLLGIGALWVVDRLARRLLPLAALFKLSLVFPDSAPSRYRVALRSGTTAQLRHRVAEIKASGHLGDTDPEAAETLLELVGALSVHDRITRGHSERVRAYTQMIGEEMGLSADDLDHLHWAGLVHDVGKLYVAEEILNKDGRLTDVEYDAIKYHPVAGAELCAPLRTWLGPWVDAVGEHHERWDGKGYPAGLACEEISLAARIVSVADVFDVITGARSYKMPKTSVEGRDELARCAGTQFDPTVVRAFLNVGIGRLRLVMGPLSWLAQVPVLNRIPLTPAFGAVVSVAAAVGLIMFGGWVHAPHVATDTASISSPVTVPIGAPTPIVDPVVDMPPPAAAPPAPPAPPHDTAVPSLPAPRPPGPSTPAPAVGWLATVGVARDDAVTVLEDHTILISPLANDDHLTSVMETDPPTSGVVQILGGTLQFTPAPDFAGIASFRYHARGDTTADAWATVAVTVEAVDDPPSFLPGPDATVVEDSGAALAAWATAISPGPANESGQALAFTVVPDDPSLFAAAPAISSTTGALTFAPRPDVNGLTGVTVVLTDDGDLRTGGSNAAAPVRFTIAITPAPDAPVARSDAATLTEDDPATAIDLLANDTDADGNTLTITTLDTSALTNGTAVDNGDGTITYTPDTDANGTDTLTYTIDDGTGRTATTTATLTITPAPDAPVANADAYATGQSTFLSVPAPGVLANDSDHDGDPLTVTTTPLSDATHGTLTLFPDGSFTYSADLLYIGTDQFTYEVQDGTGRSGQATVILTVDSGVTEMGYYLGTSGTDADNWLFSPTPVGLPGAEPDHDLDGLPGLTIRSSDQKLTETDGTKYQSWTLAPSAPLALRGPVSLDLWSTSKDFEGTKDVDYSIWLHDCAVDGTGCVLLASASDVHVDSWNGGVAAFVERDITFGSVDTTINVGRMLRMRLMFHHEDVWVAASVDRPSRLVVTEANASPIANADSATMLEDAGTQTLDVLANDVDVNLNPSTVSITADPGKGTAVPNLDGTIDYTPSADLNGVDSFTYQVCDTGGRCDTATVSLTITPVNDAPTYADAGDVVVDSSLGLQTFAAWATGILCGPADEVGQVPTFTLVVSDPSRFFSVPTVNAAGTLSIDPKPGASGTFTVTATLADDGGTADGGLDTSTVHTFTITVL